jgi:primosomal replication protein N
VTDNRLVLIGNLVKAPKYSTSPSGIPHCQFWLEHRSQQTEAGLLRQAYTNIAVVASGEGFQKHLLPLSMGCCVRVSGFLNNHRSQNGVPRMVLHAHQIDLLS